MSTHSHATLPKLSMQDDEPLEQILLRAVSRLDGLQEEAIVELRLIPTGGVGPATRYAVRLSSAGAVVHPTSDENATLTIISAPEVIRRITDGSYAPLQAFVDGQVKLHGSLDVARRMINHFTGQDTVPPCIYSSSYTAPGGILTVNGQYCTPGGKVDLLYDLGGFGFASSNATVDASGKFTDTVTGIGCGSDGVSVTAYDEMSETKTTQNVPTPC
jgi:SCP-2 sterol transfer family